MRFCFLKFCHRSPACRSVAAAVAGVPGLLQSGNRLGFRSVAPVCCLLRGSGCRVPPPVLPLCRFAVGLSAAPVDCPSGGRLFLTISASYGCLLWFSPRVARPLPDLGWGTTGLILGHLQGARDFFSSSGLSGRAVCFSCTFRVVGDFVCLVAAVFPANLFCRFELSLLTWSRGDWR